MMQMNIERMILAGLIVIAVKAIGQGIKEMDRKGEKKDADNNTSER